MTGTHLTCLEAAFLADVPESWVLGSSCVRLRPKTRQYEFVRLSLGDVLYLRRTYELVPISESDRFRIYMEMSTVTPDGHQMWSDATLRRAKEDRIIRDRLQMLEDIKGIVDRHDKTRPFVAGTCHSVHIVADHIARHGAASAVFEFSRLTAEMAEAATQYAAIYPKKGPSGIRRKANLREAVLDAIADGSG